jgi:hypothetical protein
VRLAIAYGDRSGTALHPRKSQTVTPPIGPEGGRKGNKQCSEEQRAGLCHLYTKAGRGQDEAAWKGISTVGGLRGEVTSGTTHAQDAL